MAKPQISCFVMCGGVGSRLWPLSREDNPKQFLQLAGNGSMLTKTVARLKARLYGKTSISVIASERHGERVRSELSGVDLDGGALLFEPAGRNTAAAVALATLRVLEHADGLMLVVPSDHEISTEQQFWDSIEAGIPAAESGRLVVFGLRPGHAETGYGYIEAEGTAVGKASDVVRFVEKPDLKTASGYLRSGRFFWNTGIFLFRARTMQAAFQRLRPDIWQQVEKSYAAAREDLSGIYLPAKSYAKIPSVSLDYAIMEKARAVSMVPALFRWSDLGSWKALLEIGKADANGNVATGDVVAINCERCYLHGQGRLLSAVGLKDLAVVATSDATFVAPVAESQEVKRVVEHLQRSGRLESRLTPAKGRVMVPGAWHDRVAHWLFEEALPFWSQAGVDLEYGGFHEALSFDGKPLMKPKRMRTMARQVYAFSIAQLRGWDGPADQLVSQGIQFMANGRTSQGGWVRTLNVDGSVADPAEDTYDHACVLLALAYAHKAGNSEALRLGEDTFAFLDAHLEDERLTGFRETSHGSDIRRSNPHMHLLEAFLAWHATTGRRDFLRRAARIIDLFRSHFFDPQSWTLGEYFDAEWRPATNGHGEWTEPGHHFEWASLLVDFSRRTGQSDLIGYARKLYASAIANGLNRATGLAYGAVSRSGLPLDSISRSWPQAEAIKAALALDETGGPDLKPEIESRVRRLFRWHIDPAPVGMWMDRIDEKGRAIAAEVPASIFYHLTAAFMDYLDKTEPSKRTLKQEAVSSAVRFFSTRPKPGNGTAIAPGPPALPELSTGPG